MTYSPSARQRQRFPALVDKAYFNYGGQGPMAQSCLTAIQESYRAIQQQGPFSIQVGQWLKTEDSATRQMLAEELGVPTETVTFTEDVTVGCNIALWGFDWQPGDHILLSDCEHPGIIATIQELERRFQVEVSVCPLLETLNQGDPTAVIAQYLKPNTRLMVISHILWNTGQVLPLQEIMQLCHQRLAGKVHVLVDAAQSVGILPLNLVESDVDFYAFTGHKWLCGPEGLGGLYVSQAARSVLSPTFIGWRGIQMDQTGKPVGWKPSGQRYEIATSAYPLYAGLREAITLNRRWGSARERYQRICELSELLWKQLAAIDRVQCLRTAPPESGLVSFKLTTGMSHAAAVEYLESQGIYVRTILHPNCIRACVHYFTQESEIEKLVQAIRDLPKL